MEAMRDEGAVTIIPCLTDNYAYLARCSRTGAVLVVDPGEPEPVLAAIDRAGGRLDAVLCTHHHWDHVGALGALIERFRSAKVYAHHRDASRIDGVTNTLGHDEGFVVGERAVRALHVPAHTAGALAFVLDERAVFTGDTLFSAGCGRLFEGSAAMMHAALCDTLGRLGDDVLVYPGHEYAEKNLRFASVIEPESRAVAERIERVRALRARGEPSVPSTMAEERASNPFMRVREASVRAFARGREALVDASDPAAVLAVVRRERDGF